MLRLSSQLPSDGKMICAVETSVRAPTMTTVAQAMTLKAGLFVQAAHQPLVVDEQQHQHEHDRQAACR